MSVYRVEFTAKGYIEISATDEDTAYEKALDVIDEMSSNTFMHVFENNVEATEVECIEADPEVDTSRDRHYEDCI